MGDAAAEAVAFDDYLDNDLAVPAPVRLALVENGIQRSADLLPYARSRTDLHALIKAMREPGGTIDNPDAGVVGAPARIRNPGCNVPHHIETLLLHLAFYIFHRHFHLQAPFMRALATVANIDAAFEYAETYERHKDDVITMPPVYTNAGRMRQVLDALQEYFGLKYGDIGLPLTYVVRTNVGLPIGGLPDPYTTTDLVLRARPNGVYWARDNAAVWAVLYNTFAGTPGYPIISPFARTRDGRAAFEAFIAHFLGGGNRNALYIAASARLDTLYYDGEHRNFGIAELIAGMLECFNDIRLYGEPEDALSGHAQVRHLIKNVRCTNASVAAGISTIQATPALRVNFTAASNHLRTMVTTGVSTGRGTRIAGVGRNHDVRGRGQGRGQGGRDGGRGRGFGRGRGRGRSGRYVPGGRGLPGGTPAQDDPNLDVSARNYTSTEWARLSASQRTRVLQLRQQGNPAIAGLSTLVQQIAQLQQAQLPPAAGASVPPAAPADNVGSRIGRRGAPPPPPPAHG